MAAAHAIPEEAVRTGAGLVDVDAALSKTSITRMPMTSRSARVSCTTGPDGSTIISILDPAGLYSSLTQPDSFGQIAIWGSRAKWGQIAIWGGRASGQIAIWGSRAQTGPAVLTATE